MFDFSNYGITCLSSNSIDYLSMWAYYTNNHKGFCIEYEIVKKDCIHEVLYLPDRIKVASLILQYKEAAENAITLGQRSLADFYSNIFMQNLFIKAESWKHEKEYRIIQLLDNSVGKSVQIQKLNMITKRIVAGINCTEANIEKLNNISNGLGLGNIYISIVHPEKYAVKQVKYEK